MLCTTIHRTHKTPRTDTRNAHARHNLFTLRIWQIVIHPCSQKCRSLHFSRVCFDLCAIVVCARVLQLACLSAWLVCLHSVSFSVLVVVYQWFVPVKLVFELNIQIKKCTDGRCCWLLLDVRNSTNVPNIPSNTQTE